MGSGVYSTSQDIFLISNYQTNAAHAIVHAPYASPSILSPGLDLGPDLPNLGNLIVGYTDDMQDKLVGTRYAVLDFHYGKYILCSIYCTLLCAWCRAWSWNMAYLVNLWSCGGRTMGARTRLGYVYQHINSCLRMILVKLGQKSRSRP